MSFVVHKPPSTGIITSASESASDRCAFSSSVAFCRTNVVSVPKSFSETLPMVHGWYYEVQDSFFAVLLAEEATVAETAKTTEVTTNFDAQKHNTDAETDILKSWLVLRLRPVAGIPRLKFST